LAALLSPFCLEKASCSKTDYRPGSAVIKCQTDKAVTGSTIEQLKSYRWRFVGGAVRRQTGLSTEVLRFIQHLFYRFSDFIIGELDFSVSEWVIDTISILAHQIGAPAQRQYAP